MKHALITGITGQDGSYLTELLLAKGYAVHGLVRRSSSPNTGRIAHLIGNPNLTLHYGDLTDSSGLNRWSVKFILTRFTTSVRKAMSRSHGIAPSSRPKATLWARFGY